MSSYDSVIQKLLSKARCEGSPESKWGIFHELLVAFKTSVGAYPGRSSAWIEYESERLLWVAWFRANDKTFPGIEPPHQEPAEQPRGRTMARNNRGPLCSFYLQVTDGFGRVGILRSRQSGEQRSNMSDPPTIESALAGPHFRLDNGDINFAAMNRAGLISKQELDGLMREVFLPLKGMKKGSAVPST